MKKVLIKDIIIPAGTIFIDAPTKIETCEDVFGECVIGLTKDSYGTFVYDIDGDDKEKLKEWFRDVKE